MYETEVYPIISKSTRLPQKRFYSARAHSNPLSDSHFPVPISPSHVDYSLHYPQLFPSIGQAGSSKKIQFADVGCGFGGLFISLSTLFPETLMIGMELRDKVIEYVKERISSLRVANPGQYQNVYMMKSCLENHPTFEALTEKELEADPVVKLLSSATEEGQKVAGNGGQAFQAVFRCIVPTNQAS
ncbi:hypothetical protein Fmac_000880 [Flemingia macrophylla]|uniref:tRNA (guanine(46)-N(7))-methyltransferase n=1 Tax=Flemingia macrophylla TaxID=520843 RepID=A0ABD1NIA6_9FABA